MSALQDIARRAVALMDLTSLNEDDTNEVIAALCEKALTPAGNTAAVCVYPKFVAFAKAKLAELGAEGIKVATVTNFPHGSTDINRAVEETAEAVAAGADEVDVVYPYKALLEGDAETGQSLVAECKKACGENAQLKVILETGELKDPALIRQASEDCIAMGADFIKTSTGKVPVNATAEAAEIMLTVIKEKNPECGFKPAGGMRTTEDAKVYIDLAEQILGEDYATNVKLRLGASSLLNDLLVKLDLAEKDSNAGGY